MGLEIHGLPAGRSEEALLTSRSVEPTADLPYRVVCEWGSESLVMEETARLADALALAGAVLDSLEWDEDLAGATVVVRDRAGGEWRPVECNG